MRTICIFGDNIAAGKSAPNEEGWAHHFKKFVEERDPEISVINVSKIGATSRGVLSRIEGSLVEHKPEEVVIALGLNDSAYSFMNHCSLVSIEEFEKNMREIVSMSLGYSKKVVVFGVLRVDERGSTFSDKQNSVYQYQNGLIQKYNEILKTISESLNVQFVDLYGLLSDEELDDGYHPNDEGHKKLFKEVLKALGK